MKRNPTMKDVAKVAGVSVMTVSRAFKQEASVGEETRKNIQDTAELLGYVFDSSAANLRSQRSNFVAVTIPSLNSPNFAATVEALTTALSSAGYQVLLGHTNYDIQREEELIAEFLRRKPEAIVVTGGRHTDKARKMLAASGVPVVETWDLPENPIDHVVGFSNAAVVTPLVNHLVAKGLTQIGFIGGDTDCDTRGIDRRLGFIRAMEAHNLSAERLVGSGVPQQPMRDGGIAMAQLLERFPQTQAVICVSDAVGFGALSECQRRGISVPDEMAIVGFGAYDISEVCVPSLTTIDPQSKDIGAMAAQLVIDVLVEPKTGLRHAIEPALRVGGSSGNSMG